MYGQDFTTGREDWLPVYDLKTVGKSSGIPHGAQPSAGACCFSWKTKADLHSELVFWQLQGWSGTGVSGNPPTDRLASTV